MDFIDACKVILRRWYVAVPLLLLTFAGTYYAYTSASSNYTAKASLVLISPPSRTIGEDTGAVCPSNPWCAGGDVLNLANVVSRQMEDPGLAGELLDPHPGASYEVLLNAENRSTIMELTVTARTPADAIATLNELIGEVNATLAARQDKVIVGDTQVDPVDIVTTDVLTKSTQATPQSGGKLRAGAAAFGLGIAITLGGVFLAESLAVSRRTKASLLDRIALPEQQTNGGKGRRPSIAGAPTGDERPDDARVEEARVEEARPRDGTATEPGSKPVPAGVRRSGRVGS